MPVLDRFFDVRWPGLRLEHESLLIKLWQQNQQYWKSKLDQKNPFHLSYQLSQYCNWPSFSFRAPLIFFCLLNSNFSSADNHFLLLYLHDRELKNTNAICLQNRLFTDGPIKVSADEQQLITHSCYTSMYILWWRWDKVRNLILYEVLRVSIRTIEYFTYLFLNNSLHIYCEINILHISHKE